MKRPSRLKTPSFPPRRGRFFITGVTLTVLSLVGPAAFGDETAPPYADTLAASRGAVSFDTAAPEGEYHLPHKYIFFGSEKVTSPEGEWTRGVDYEIDYETGTLTVLKPSPYPLPLHVVYQYLPLLTDGDLARVLAEENPAESLERWQEEQNQDNLEITGSKTFSVSAGSDGASSLDQSLRLSLKGTVGEVKVTGEITDQSLPLENGGVTEDIEAVDKVSVRVEGRRWAGTFGDYDFTASSRRFASFERRFTGVEAEAYYPEWEGRALGARSRGRYASNEFYGIDGVQGPYHLTTRGDEDIVVLPGTEKVWFNGELLKRGENNDYTLDYDLASITFTARRPISAQDRVVVDFQYSTDEYRRDAFGVDAQWRSPGDVVALNALYFQEGDDRSRDRFGLTPAEKERLLPIVGDDVERARVVARDGEGNVIYDYVGPGNGSFRRDWDPVAGRFVYTFVGAGNGDFAPRTILLPLPSRKDLLDLKVALSPSRLLTLTAEGASSEADLNTFSPLGDEDNAGLAGAFDAAVHLNEWEPLAGTGELEVRLRGENRDERFQGPGRADDVVSLAEWDLEDDVAGLTKLPRQKLYEITLREKPAEWMEAWGTYGGISHVYAGVSARGYRDHAGERYAAGTILGGGEGPRLTYTYNDVRRGGQRGTARPPAPDQLGYNLLTFDLNRRRDHTGKLTWDWGRFSPFAAVVAKDRTVDYGSDGTRDDGTRDVEVTGGSGVRPAPGWSLTYGRSYLYGDKMRNDRWVRAYRGDGDSLTAAYEEPNLLYGSLQYERSLKDFAPAGDDDVQSDLAAAEISYTPLRRSLGLRTRYDLTSTQNEEREEYFDRAPDGDGDYRREPDPRRPGRYLYVYDPEDPEAVYVKKYRNTGRKYRTAEPDLTVQLEIKPYVLNDTQPAGEPRKKRLDAAAASGYIHVSHASTSKNRDAVWLKDLWGRAARETAYDRSLTIDVLPTCRTVTGTARWSRKDELDRTVAARATRSYRVSRYGEVRGAPTASSSLQLDVEGLREMKTVEEENVYRPDVTIATEMVYGATPAMRLSRVWEVAVRGEYSDRRETYNDAPTRIRGYKTRPEATARFAGAGVAKLWYERTLYSVSGYLASETLFFRVPGVNHKWEASLDKGVGQYIVVVLTYGGEKGADDPRALHRGRVDLNIYF